MAWLSVNDDMIIASEDQVGLRPLDPGVGLSFDVGRKLNLGSGPGGQTSQKFHVQLDLWWFCLGRRDRGQYNRF